MWSSFRAQRLEKSKSFLNRLSDSWISFFFFVVTCDCFHHFVPCTMCYQICDRLKGAHIVEQFDAKVNGKVGL